MKLSVVLATRNEEENIGRCLSSVKRIAEEIIIYDEGSTDNTVKIAKSFGAKVFNTVHESNFHITKQKAIDKAKGEWILQLDADEELSPSLQAEILDVIKMSDSEIMARRPENSKDWELFNRNQMLIEERDGKMGKRTGEVVAFFVPRINMFVGHPLISGGRYPDGAIRLIKNGKAKLPAKSVHEVMDIEGEVAWLFNPLYHYDSPTLTKYIMRLNRYTELEAQDLKDKKVSKSIWNLFLYNTFYPVQVFFNNFFLTAGFRDGLYGFAWATFSAWHMPISYFKYYLEL